MTRLVCVGLFLAACTACTTGGDDGGAVCGNLACEAGESSFTCPGDCSAATCDPAIATSCGGETICISQQCVPAFGRNYVFTVTSGTFPQFDETGTPWDAGGGLPDGYVKLTINAAVFTTPTVPDNLHPTWNYATPATIVPGGTVLRIDVLDEDLAVDDNAWACQANPLSADLLRSRLISCNGPATLPGATVTLDVRPN